MKTVKILIAASLATAASAASPTSHSETAVLAGGCFWGMEAVFEHVKGVTDVVSGFAGGAAKDATYDRVSSEGTRHAEAVKITFDPSRISYAQVLQIYFSVAHDPTQVNRQGPDTGPSYRSAIFPQTAGQRAVAAKMIELLKSKGVRVATKIEPGHFYAAEDYHQDFARKHPDYPYIVVNDLPKVRHLKAKYPQWWKA